MTAEQLSRHLAMAMPERELQANVSELCRRLGALHYHTHDSRRSEEGFPDSIILAPGMLRPRPLRLIVAEHKRQKKNPTPRQDVWLDAFESLACDSCGRVVSSVHVWRPEDWLNGKIEDVIRGRVDARDFAGAERGRR